MPLSGLEKSILLSVSYSNVFSFPLNSREVWLRLITKEPVSYKEVKDALVSLLAKNKLSKQGDYYFITDKKLVSLREKRENYTQEKLQQAEKFIHLAKKIPFIKAICITGSVSVNNAKKNDDIDWLIITADDSLWLVRPLVILIASLYGKRRERDGHHRDNSWCFNMFLTESNLEVAPHKKNIYTAYEVCQALFVYDSASIEEKFLRVNSWASSYVANYWQVRLHETLLHAAISSREIFQPRGFLIQALNRVLYVCQFLYMKPKITREVVALHIALFHPRNTQSKVLQKWKAIIKNVS